MGVGGCVCACARARVYVLFISNISISIICVSQEEFNLILHLINTYDFYKSVIFEKERHCRKYMFDISEYSIQCNADSSCEHMTSGVNIYLNRYVNILAPECAVCACVCMCVYVISSQGTSKNPDYVVPGICKYDASLRKTHQSPDTKVLRLGMCKSIGQNLKGKQYRGSLHTVEGFRNPLQTMDTSNLR